MSTSQQILLGNAPTGGYQIERSLRFNSADSAYLNRTPASAGNRKTWTWSGWVKKAQVGGASGVTLFSGGTTSGNTGTLNILFNASDKLVVSSNTTSFRVSTAVYRDPSSWYHVLISVDTTQATANNRIRVYVNGSEVTAFDTTNNPTQNDDTGVNNTEAHNVGRRVYSSDLYLNGYLTEINFIDGSALDPTSFGEFNTDTGVWQPKAYTGSYGTNGFYLNFSDNASTTTLGDDLSGNGNNWTPNNFSVTAGAGNDSLVDTPTNYGTDTGVGGEVRGNYATMNPLDKAGSGSTTFSNGNLTIAVGDNANPRGTFYVNSGKWYWEGTVTAGPSVATIGIAESGFYSGNLFDTASTAKGYIYINDGTKRSSLAGSATAYGNSYTTNDVIGVALDMDAGTVKFYKNGTVQNSGTAAYTGLTGNHAPYFQGYGGTATWDVNFGQRPFAYTAPSGFKALCTQNLPDPTIVDGSEYFNTILYTGTGSSNARTGVGFQPDWVWIKERSGAADHGLYDAVRGVQNQLESNTDTAETAEATGLTAFGSDGFTVGALAQLNTNTDTYVAWNWNAGGSNATNTDGTITSTVRANTTAGFSIVSFTSVASTNSTIGHGLGVAPSFIIVRYRSVVVNWYCWHSAFAGTEYIVLDSTAAKGTLASLWNSNAPTSTVFSMGTAWTSSAPSIAYCFAAIPGYSAFGSYTGNGSADGPFVYLGFKPAMLIWKRTDSTSDWSILDSARNPSNAVTEYLYPNLSNATGTPATYTIDFVSNGFKIRGAGTAYNGSGVNVIYMAFAENPFKISLAR